MKVMIDLQDGNGPVDYSQALCAIDENTGPVVITRALNEPSIARLHLDCASHDLTTPAIHSRVTITADNGTCLFTGYLPSAPEPTFAGYTSSGPHYRWTANVLSEDWLLNRTAVPQAAPLLGQSAGQMVRTVTSRVNPSLVQMNGLEDVGTIGFFQPRANESWAENVAALANQARAAYRVLNGELTLAPIGSTVHDMTDTNGEIQDASLSAADMKQIVNDVTLTGKSEPMQYVTELFQGDGATVLFQLQREPFRVERALLLDEEFSTPALNPSIWQINDAGGYFQVSGDGLTLTGGPGTDGTATVAAIDPIELGGEVVIESGFVQMNDGSDGVLCGLYSGPITIANCLAGFRVRTSGTNTMLIPLVNGNEVGTTFSLETGHRYVIRLRIHSPELLRMNNSYFSYGVNGPAVYGGGAIPSPLNLLFEVQDMALAPYMNVGSTILYDGSIPSSPPIATFASINSLNLTGSVGYFKVKQPGTLWVVSTPASGSPFTRRIGGATQGADCNVFRNGFLHFYKLAIPQPGEILAVTYRTAAPSVARFAVAPDTNISSTLPPVSQWVGHVERPAARSSVDCENACRALLNFSVNSSAGWKGSYSNYNLQDGQDIWPGDVLDFHSATTGLNGDVVVRRVRIESTSSFPEVLHYDITFANDWADSISLRLTSDIAPDAILPATPQKTPANYLPNLIGLEVTSATASTITVNTNQAPPTNGGFEVRSRDYTFGATIHDNLVLRSSSPSFTIARSADEEQYYIRMYDGSTPPLYSRVSSSIFTNIPVA